MNQLNAIFNIKGIESEYNLGNTVSCILCVTPNEDLEVGTFTCNLIGEVRGLVIQHAEELYSTQIQVNRKLSAGKTYEFPFSVYNKSKISYIGQSVSQSLILTVTNDDGPDSLMDRMKKKLIGRKTLITREVTFRKPAIFSVKSNDYKLEAKFGIHIIGIGFAALVAGLIAITMGCKQFASSESTMIFALSSYVLLILSGFAAYLFINYLVGTITVKLHAENDQFKMEVNNSNNWKYVSEIKASYAIIERVIDRRGTTNSILNATIYSSELKEIISPTNNSKVDFHYPDYSFPGNNDLKDTTFIPTINLKLITPFGIKQYTGPFDLITEIA